MGAHERLEQFRGEEKVASGKGSAGNVNPTFKIGTDEPTKDLSKKGYLYVIVKALVYIRTHGGTAHDFSPFKQIFYH